ncbi:MAG: cyclophilin-like fold protein [Bacteroidia bacterium]|nr:cyclophilin-like fold protein [Bacteroidia bacterium]
MFSIGINRLNAQSQSVKITVGTSEFIATLENNPTANAFVQLLPLTINMSELGGVEKYYYFPSGTTLPTNASNPGTIQTGDLMLYGNNCLVLFYTTFNTSYSYTKIGKIDNVTGLVTALGTGNVIVTYELYNPAMSVNDWEVKNNLVQVSPNPATDYFQISGVEFNQLSLYDMNGKVVNQSKQNTVSTSNIPSGVYFLKIDTKQHETISKKIIVK